MPVKPIFWIGFDEFGHPHKLENIFDLEQREGICTYIPARLQRFYHPRTKAGSKHEYLQIMLRGEWVWVRKNNGVMSWDINDIPVVVATRLVDTRKVKKENALEMAENKKVKRRRRMAA